MLRQIVVLAGGGGTRLGPLTTEMPKPLLPVGGRPFLDRLLNEYGRFGLNRALVLAGYKGDRIRNHYEGQPLAGINVQVLVEPAPLGTAGALREAHALLDEQFVLANGDTFVDFNVLGLQDDVGGADWLAKIALCRIDDARRFGKVRLGPRNRVLSFAEKDQASGAGLINAGVYLLRRQLVERIDPGRTSLEQEVFPQLAQEGLLIGVPLTGRFIDIGVPESYHAAQSEIDRISRRPAAFLDRDGVLNVDNGYTHKVRDLQWIPGAREAVRLLNDRGNLVFVVTNQSGVARGLYDEEAVHRFHDQMQLELREIGAHVDEFAYCPHLPDGTVPAYAQACSCRKPATGMLQRLADKWDIRREASFLIGDTESDIACSRSFGIRGHAFSGGNLMELVEGILPS